MTSTAKIVLGVVIVLVVAGALWYWYAASHQMMLQPAGQGAAMNDSTALPSGSDTSDAALNQDMNAINANMQASDADSSAVDQSVNAESSGSTQ